MIPDNKSPIVTDYYINLTWVNSGMYDENEIKPVWPLLGGIIYIISYNQGIFFALAHNLVLSLYFDHSLHQYIN